MKMNLIILISLISFISCSAYFRSNKSKYVNQNNLNNIDTIYLDKDSYQLVKKNDNNEILITLVNKSKDLLGEVVSQEITFHENGVIKSISIYHSYEINNKGEEVVQSNYLELSIKGILQRNQFMESYKVISEYKKE